MRTTAIRHIGLVVRKLDPVLIFYRDLLGFTILSRQRESGSALEQVLGRPQVEVETVKLAARDGEAVLELLDFRSPTIKNGGSSGLFKAGWSHLAVTVKDLSALYERLKSAGVPCNAPPQVSADGKVLMTFCQDPEGNWVELVQPL